MFLFPHRLASRRINGQRRTSTIRFRRLRPSLEVLEDTCLLSSVFWHVPAVSSDGAAVITPGSKSVFIAHHRNAMLVVKSDGQALQARPMLELKGHISNLMNPVGNDPAGLTVAAQLSAASYTPIATIEKANLPEGWAVDKSASHATNNNQVVVFVNKSTKQAVITFMGTNNFNQEQVSSDLLNSGASAYAEIKPLANSALHRSGVSITVTTWRRTATAWARAWPRPSASSTSSAVTDRTACRSPRVRSTPTPTGTLS